MREEIINYVRSKGWKYSLSSDGNWVRLNSCPICGKTSRKPFAINTKEGTAHCHHGECGWSGGLTLLKQHFGDLVFKLKEERKAFAAPPESLIKELEDRFWNSPSLIEKFSAFRCIDEKHIKMFRLGLDERRGVAYPSFQNGKPVCIKFKRRTADGKDIKAWVGPKGESCRSVLYNVNNLRGNDIVYITEGEDDCIILTQLGYKNVVSIPHGSATLRGEWLNPLESFHDVVIFMDGDPAGRKAAEGLASVIGKDRCRIVEFPEGIIVPPGPWSKTEYEAKDITDLVRAGKSDLIKELIDGAPLPKHDTVVHVSDFIDVFLEDFKNGNRSRGATTGFPSLDAVIGGRRPGELTVITGNTSSGKTTLAFNVAMNVVRLGEPVLMSAFEHGPKKIIEKASSWITGKTRFLGSTNEMTLQDAEYAASVMKDMPLYIINHYGVYNPERYIECMRYSQRRLMVTTAVLDHLHHCISSKSFETERHDIDRAMLALRGATEQTTVNLMVVAHPRQKQGEENPTIGLTDLRGSSFISQVADNVWICWRDDNLQKLKPGYGRSIVYVKKTRSECGTVGQVEMVFDMNGQKFLDPLGSELDFVEDLGQNEFNENEFT